MTEPNEKTIDDGGPAFPVVCVGEYSPGMSLRDWFAGQALAGLVEANEDIANDGNTSKASAIAQAAYQYALFMIEQRGRILSENKVTT